MRRVFCLLFALSVMFPSAVAAASDDEFSFDISEFEKKPYEIGGYLEPALFIQALDRDSALYRLKFHDAASRKSIDEYRLTAQISGEYAFGPARLYGLLHGLGVTGDTEDDVSADLFEGHFSIESSPALSVKAGKQVLLWGKGYAWNPVSLVDRPKNPDEPELSREGFSSLSADYIRSFGGRLSTVAFTPVLIPVSDDVNTDFGEAKALNAGGKLYLLYRDTDIDIMFLTGKSRGDNIGIDFSRNLTSNFEIHGELACYFNETTAGFDESDALVTETSDTASGLFGLRFLTTTDLTIIAEYYHNGAGYALEDMDRYYELTHEGFELSGRTGDDALLRRMAGMTKDHFSGQNLMKNYLYLRGAQKEPFGLLYFNPAVTAIVNLDDLSASIAPEALYSPTENLSFKCKATFLAGGKRTEFGEKPNDYKLEFTARYYF